MMYWPPLRTAAASRSRAGPSWLSGSTASVGCHFELNPSLQAHPRPHLRGPAGKTTAAATIAHAYREAGKGQAIGVKNGTLATLEKVSPDRFVARLDDGRRVAFSPDQYNHIAHGYAVTIHKSQGATVDRT